MSNSVWVDSWEDCSRPGVDEVCQRNVGYFRSSSAAGFSSLSQGPVPKPVPDPQRELSGSRLAAVESAYDDALAVLKDSNCAKYIGADAAKGIDPAKMLKHIRQQGKLLDGGADPGRYASATPNGMASVITFYDLFFSSQVGSSIPGVSQYHVVDVPSARVLLLLHELRHAATGIFHPDDGFWGDPLPDVPESNEDFNRNIMFHCFGIKVGGP